MNRRELLRTASIAGAGIVGLAGCSSPDDGAGTEGTEPGVGTGTETEVGTGTETEIGAGNETATETEMGTANETGTGTANETGTGTANETGTGTANETGTGTANETTTTTGTGTGGSASYEFLGNVEGWVGQSPSSIEGQTNPTIQLQAGQQYEISWTNDDGAPHDFTIQDSSGNTIEQSEQLSEQGATTTLTFTASSEMAQYICTIHPSTMVGTIEMSS